MDNASPFQAAWQWRKFATCHLLALLLLILWLLWFPLVMGLYVKYFPRVSRYLGYGSVKDEPGEPTHKKIKQVTLYTALGCPFCPLVERRLRELQKERDWEQLLKN